MKYIYKTILFILVIAAQNAVQNTCVAQGMNEGKVIFHQQDKTMTVYPVPTNNIANIKFSPALKLEVSRVEIVNIVGQKIAEQNIVDKSVNEVVFTDLGKFPEGIYMVLARDAHGKLLQSAKMIIK